MQETKNNVTVRTDDEYDLGNPPYFYSPYPERLVQIKEGETRGARDVIQLINNNWKKTVNELEDISKENDGDGYSGSFIRNILRSHYIPEDMVEETVIDDKPETQDGAETMIESREVEEKKAVKTDIQNIEWDEIFRFGIRCSLNGDVTLEEAINSFESGFEQGEMLKREME